MLTDQVSVTVIDFLTVVNQMFSAGQISPAFNLFIHERV